MCSFCGFCDSNNDISSPEYTEILKVLSNNLNSNQEDFYSSSHVNLGYRKLISVNHEECEQPMICKYEDNTYTIVYNGQLYNSKELRTELINYGYEFNRF